VPHILYRVLGNTGEDTIGGCMSDKRFTALETMVAYHEDTIQKLDDVVYKQQIMIDKLKDKVDTLARLLQAAEQSVADVSEK
jgi:uncharacterized coiled-coil protein SlyX